MTNKPKLKPCPFCGEEMPVRVEKHWAEREQVFFYGVGCNWCGGQSGGCRTKANAIAAWNRRYPVKGKGK